MNDRLWILNVKKLSDTIFDRHKRRIFSFWIVLISGCWILLSFSFGSESPAAEITAEDSLYTVALGAYKNGFYDLAIDQFKKFLDLYPASQKAPFAWFRLGEAYGAQSKDPLAEAAYQKVLNLYPAHKLTPVVLFRLAGVQFKRRDFSSALSNYQKLLQEFPSSDFAKEAQFWIGESLYQLKRYTDALAAYRTFIHNASTHEFISHALYGEGWCLMELGRYDEAIKQFKGLLEKNPPEDLRQQTHLGLGNALFELKDYKEAIVHFSAYKEARPDDLGRVILKQGFALSYLGLDEDAVKLFQDFLKTASNEDDQTPDVLFRLGITLQRLKRDREALNTFGTLKEQYPNRSIMPEVIYQMGILYLNMNNHKLAEQEFQRVVEEFSDHERALPACLHIGNILYQSGRIKEAIGYYSKAANTKDQSLAAEARYRLAESLFLTGAHHKAIQELDALIDSLPHQPLWVQMAGFYLGNIYEQKGDLKLARHYYSQVIQVKGGTNDLSQASQNRITAIQAILKGKKMQEKNSEKANVMAREKGNESIP